MGVALATIYGSVCMAVLMTLVFLRARGKTSAVQHWSGVTIVTGLNAVVSMATSEMMWVTMMNVGVCLISGSLLTAASKVEAEKRHAE